MGAVDIGRRTVPCRCWAHPESPRPCGSAGLGARFKRPTSRPVLVNLRLCGTPRPKQNRSGHEDDQGQPANDTNSTNWHESETNSCKFVKFVSVFRRESNGE